MRATATVAAALAIIGFTEPPAAAQPAPRVMKVVEHAVSDAISVHGGTAADNVGDILTFANAVFDAKDQAKVGSDQGYCVRLVVGKMFECHWTLFLPEGQLVVDGPFYDAADSTLAVTGGTGAYATTRGEMVLHARDAKGSAYDFTYRLQ